MSKWNNFSQMTELEQANFLIGQAREAVRFIKINHIRERVSFYIELAESLLKKKSVSDLHRLVIFLEDPDMKEDFNAYFSEIDGDNISIAALDIASYACGFICRIAFNEFNISPVPEPVLLSLPDEYGYFANKAKILEID